jgi:geranylgeranyl reductase family protein
MDVAVIGAGPGGAWAAYCLARAGARVLLIDASHPREKPCGGGITGRALALVSAALYGVALPTTTIRSARFFDSTTKRSAAVPLSVPDAEFPPDLVVAGRREFDGALLAVAQEAGAELLPSRVTDVVRERQWFRIETASGPRRAPIVIGADGANSIVRRRLAQPFRRDQISIATGYFAAGSTSEEIVIELIADPPGYIWSFPRPTHLAVGVCTQADSGVAPAALRERVRAWIGDAGLPSDTPLTQYSWPIPSLSAADFDSLALGDAGWFLVGDAAGLVDPITREGIYFALLSAQAAADALIAADAYASYRYIDRVYEEIVGELVRAAEFKEAFFRPDFITRMIDAVGRSAAVRTVLADLIAGRQRYTTLKWRLLRTCEFRLALEVGRAYLAT